MLLIKKYTCKNHNTATYSIVVTDSRQVKQVYNKLTSDVKDKILSSIANRHQLILNINVAKMKDLGL